MVGAPAASGPHEGRGAVSGPHATGLAERFRDHLAATGALDGARHAVIAVSGGVDSMTLLHLLRFGAAEQSPSLHAAHLDHRMRSGSAADAEWLGEVCARWGVEFHLRAVATPVRTEAEGRELRYAFLAEVAKSLGAGAVVLTGHNAADQAETVLFRIARGSGPRGLGGIDPGRPPAPLRPLLPFRRAGIEAYAAAHEVPHREDPTNRDPRWTRNRIRHEVLPALEAAVPGATAALTSLAGTSRVESAALDQLLDERIAALALAVPAPVPQPALSFDRDALAAIPDHLLTVLLRRAARRMGASPGRAATAALLSFVREGASGRRVGLQGGATVEHHLGCIHFRAAGAEGLEPRAAPPGTATSPLPEPGAATPPAAGPSFTGPTPHVRVDPPSGEASFTHGACSVGLCWQPPEERPPVREPRPARAVALQAAAGGARLQFVAHFALSDVRFSLGVRPWAPGDRITLPYGRKKVKKLLLEARVPANRREGWPVVADAAGAIVWVPGSVEPAFDPRSVPGHGALRLEVRIG